jgi:hypothetical protein
LVKIKGSALRQAFIATTESGIWVPRDLKGSDLVNYWFYITIKGPNDGYSTHRDFLRSLPYSSARTSCRSGIDRIGVVKTEKDRIGVVKTEKPRPDRAKRSS